MSKRHCPDAICCVLQELRHDTPIKALYYGGEVSFRFKGMKDDCIRGLTMEEHPIFLDCKKLLGVSIVPLL